MAELAKATVERALKRYRYLAGQFIWGGMYDDHKLATEALEALERLVEVAQPTLLEVEKEESA